MKELENCKTLQDVALKIFNKSYYNGKVKKMIVEHYREHYGIDIEQYINEKKKKYCLNCGKLLSNNRNKFCSSSCAASYNNKKRGRMSEETKLKISETIHLNSIKKNKDEKYYNPTIKRFVFKKTCECGKEFFTYHKYQKYCSRECSNQSNETKEKLRKKQLEKVANGTHSGWKSRNITSFPEQFWINVLNNNNNITFEREDFSTKKYFLDFLIYKNDYKIDLEIDGNQHSFRKEHDKKRDEYLTANGFIVYRISWNSINTDKGKERMKEKIDRFLEFYQNLQ